MMVNAITILQERLGSIKNHLKVLREIETIIKSQQIDNEGIRFLQSQQTEEKIFNYRANIISLYGVFEFFIEEVFKEYIENLKRIVPKYDSLNDRIKNNYFDNVSKLHSKLNYAKFSHINERQIAQNIERVIVQNINEILPESFLGNGGNYKHDVICSLMNSIGVLDIDNKITILPPLPELLSESLQPNREQIREKIKIRIKDLVDRRNEVAHGVITDNIIDLDEFEEMLTFVSAYCIALNKLLECELLINRWDNNTSKSYSPINVFGECIVELKVSNFQLSVGNKILIKKSIYPNIIEANVEEIRIKDNATGKIIPQNSIQINDEECEISFKLSSKINTNNEFKISN